MAPTIVDKTPETSLETLAETLTDLGCRCMVEAGLKAVALVVG